MATGGGGLAVAGGAVLNGAGGRFVGTEELTELQTAFVDAYVANGGNARAAAVTAGYADGARNAWKLRHNPAVSRAITEAREAAVMAGTQVALATYIAVAQDVVAPPAARVTAADRIVAWAERHTAAKRTDGKPAALAAPAGDVSTVMQFLAVMGQKTTVSPGSGQARAVHDLQAVDITDENEGGKCVDDTVSAPLAVETEAGGAAE